MEEIFTQAEIENLAAEIDRQLAAFGTSQASSLLKNWQRGDSIELDRFFVEQCQAIEAQTQEKPRPFFTRFRAAAKKDLCQEGGLLHTQWQKWRDLSSQSAVNVFGPVLSVGIAVRAGRYDGVNFQVLQKARWEKYLTCLSLNDSCLR